MLIDHTAGLTNTKSAISTIKNDIENIREKLKLEMQALLNNYTYLYGSTLGNMFSKYISTVDWANTPEPRDLNPIIFEMNKRLDLIETEIETFFNKKPVIKAEKSKGDKAMFLLNYYTDRVLANRTKIFIDVKDSREDLIMSIMRMSLKTFYEEVRNLRLSKFGYQQIQIDMRFIETILEKIYGIDDELKVLKGSFEEVIHSAKIRCVDPSDIDEAVIEAIMEVKLKKITG
eukprot:TRINITY_DN9239_c0_g3_i1.p1 TRINITY_DN9239_c0_g3~~TRINITY_DN9239_c0_g3_i1.p1  ORF type:complete len:231 (+),score=74.29 TRINITY_DN9239_c0_g3_i1:1763-2455(+)